MYGLKTETTTFSNLVMSMVSFFVGLMNNISLLQEMTDSVP